MAHVEPLSALIVAGGRSQRLGQDKRKLRLWGPAGPTLLEHTVELARLVTADVLVALPDADAWPNLQARPIADRWPSCGPLAGVAAGLAAASADWLLVLAADLPLLNLALIQTLLAVPRCAHALVPYHQRWEPLVALYHRATLPGLEQYVAVGGRSLVGWIETINAQQWSPSTHMHAFTNVNTPADLRAAQAWLAQQEEL